MSLLRILDLSVATDGIRRQCVPWTQLQALTRLTWPTPLLAVTRDFLRRC